MAQKKTGTPPECRPLHLLAKWHEMSQRLLVAVAATGLGVSHATWHLLGGCVWHADAAVSAGAAMEAMVALELTPCSAKTIVKIQQNSR